MARLSTVESLRKRIGYDDTNEINAALGAALTSATALIAARLRTPLDRAARTDYFMPRWMLRNGGYPSLQLQLRAGFLTDAPLGVAYAATMASASAGAGIAIPSTPVDRVMGHVSVGGIELANNAIRVDYVAGFEAEGDSYKDVPDWLADAAEQLALVILDRTKPEMRGDETAGAENQKMRERSVMEALQPYIRYMPSAEKPL